MGKTKNELIEELQICKYNLKVKDEFNNNQYNLLWQKDKRIAELETELEKLGKTLMYAVNLDIERINRIAELEKEKQTTVKEFANEIITKMNEDISIAEDYGKIRSIIISLLKEKGIE